MDWADRRVHRRKVGLVWYTHRAGIYRLLSTSLVLIIIINHLRKKVLDSSNIFVELHYLILHYSTVIEHSSAPVRNCGACVLFRYSYYSVSLFSLCVCVRAFVCVCVCMCVPRWLYHIGFAYRPTQYGNHLGTYIFYSLQGRWWREPR